MRGAKKILALIHDPLEPISTRCSELFGHDATAEWESARTLSRIEATWASLGYEVLRLCPNKHFFKTWNENLEHIALVHPVLEGWGSIAREGWIPSLCEFSGVPYIGTGPLGMTLAMRKSSTKALAAAAGVLTAPYLVIRDEAELQSVPRSFFAEPHFIKPDCEGSGMGIDAAHSVSQSFEQTQETVRILLSKYRDGVLVEKYLGGAEYTAAVIGPQHTLLPIAQIEVPTGVYGLANKSKEYMGEKVTFPKLSPELKRQMEHATVTLARELRCNDFVRIDFKCDGSKAYFLEANPLAGLSYFYSVLPKMAYEAGFTYETLLEELASSALKRAESARELAYGRLCRQFD